MRGGIRDMLIQYVIPVIVLSAIMLIFIALLPEAMDKEIEFQDKVIEKYKGG